MSAPPTKRPRHRVYETMTPEQRHERALKAALARTDPETKAASLVAAWPALTSDQKLRIRSLLRPVVRARKGGGDDAA
jgi:hypothetical protein